VSDFPPSTGLFTVIMVAKYAIVHYVHPPLGLKNPQKKLVCIHNAHKNPTFLDVFFSCFIWKSTNI